jgi:undecaprenyl phosphate N,N'-diacetylbacillosamine 1-phosphate transferase
MYKLLIKRALDIVVSFVMIGALSPLLLAISFILIPINKGSPFFIQERPGKNEKLFKLIKFKTMIDRELMSKKYINLDEGKIDILRTTKFGNFLRVTSLDELPELINVLKGEMSLVGPRPLLREYLDIYTHEHKKRHESRPGITGLAQVMGRNAISWKDKLNLDIDYVNNISFSGDLKILISTFLTIFKFNQVNSSKSETMSKLYKGYEY